MKREQGLPMRWSGCLVIGALSVLHCSSPDGGSTTTGRGSTSTGTGRCNERNGRLRWNRGNDG